MKVIDDFLSEGEFDTVSNFFNSSSLPWLFNDHIAGENDSLDNFQFVHNFFNNAKPFRNYSKYADFIRPVITKISPHSLIRIKANLRPRTSQPFQSDFHTDFEFPQKTAIFYINSNNGYTVFEDDSTKVFSKANRLLVFDGSRRHAGTSCTDQKVRLVLNINYFPTELDPLR